MNPNETPRDDQSTDAEPLEELSELEIVEDGLELLDDPSSAPQPNGGTQPLDGGLQPLDSGLPPLQDLGPLTVAAQDLPASGGLPPAGGLPPVRLPAGGAVGRPQRAAAPETGGAAKIIRAVRVGLVLVCCALLCLILIVGWRTAESQANTPGGMQFAKTEEEQQAAAEVPRVEKELKEVRAQNAKLRSPSRPQPARPTQMPSPHGGERGKSAYLRELERSLSRPDFSHQLMSRILQTRRPEEVEPGRELIRAAIQSGNGHLGSICRMVMLHNDEDLRKELLASLTSAEDVRFRYNVSGVDGMAALMVVLPEADSRRLLPIALALSSATSGTGRGQLKSLIDGDEAVRLAAPLAFHYQSNVRDLVRGTVDKEALYPAAIAAVSSGGYQQAVQAALWLSQQEVDDTHREAVMKALEPKLWISTDHRTFPAVTAWMKWGTPKHAPQLARALMNDTGSLEVLTVCLKVAEWDPKQLVPILKANENRDRVVRQLARAVAGNEDLADAVQEYLRTSVPHDNHAPYLSGLIRSIKKEDLEWLLQYQQRIGETNLESRSRVHSMVDLLVKKAQASGE